VRGVDRPCHPDAGIVAAGRGTNPNTMNDKPLRFVIPWVPPSLNRALRSHWAVNYRKKNVAAGYILAGCGKSHAPAPERVKVTIQMYRKKPMDRDGAQGACKPLFDVLVQFGWAKDDSERHMEQVVLPVVLDKVPKTEILIEKLA